MKIPAILSEYTELRKVSLDGANAFLRQAISKNYELSQIQLICESQRTLANTYLKDSRLYSPLKLMFFFLLALSCYPVHVAFNDNPVFYVVIFIASFFPLLDSYNMWGLFKRHVNFADAIEYNMSYFREYFKNRDVLDEDAEKLNTEDLFG